jgi:hypothetical protein
VCLPWQQCTDGISAFHSWVVVDLWQSLCEWRLLLSECVLVCRRENVEACIRALFLASKQITVLEHLPYSSDLALSDFFLFPKIKEILKWRYFDDNDDIRSNTMAALKVSPQNQFQNCFEGWTRRWHRCIASQWSTLKETTVIFSDNVCSSSTAMSSRTLLSDHIYSYTYSYTHCCGDWTWRWAVGAAFPNLWSATQCKSKQKLRWSECASCPHVSMKRIATFQLRWIAWANPSSPCGPYLSYCTCLVLLHAFTKCSFFVSFLFIHFLLYHRQFFVGSKGIWRWTSEWG